MLSYALPDPESQKWLAKAIAVGFLHPAKTLESIVITHERKEVTFEVRSLNSKNDVGALSKLDREVTGFKAMNQDYRVDKNFGFGAWLKIGDVSTMDAFLSIIDVPPAYKSAWNSLLNTVEGMGNDCTDYGVISLFLSKEKYRNGELDTKFFREVVQFYMKQHEGKIGRGGKKGLMARFYVDNAPPPKELEEKIRGELEREMEVQKHYIAFYKNVGFIQLGRDAEGGVDVMAVSGDKGVRRRHYRVDKNFGFGAWLTIGDVSTMEAFFSIIDIPPAYKSVLNGLLNKVKGMTLNDSADYGMISLFLSKDEYKNGELNTFYMEKHKGKIRGKKGLMARFNVDSALPCRHRCYGGDFRSIGENVETLVLAREKSG